VSGVIPLEVDRRSFGGERVTIQPDLWGDERPAFTSARDRYGLWPLTVWDCDISDPFTRDLRAQIGDDGSARSEVFTSATNDKSVYRGKVTESVFNPAVAMWALETGTCFDPFAGGGTRAIMAAAYGLDYVGTELRSEEVTAVRARVERAGYRDSVRIVCGDARAARDSVGIGVADFLLTCPPYWNLERYGGGDDDLSETGSLDEFEAGLDEVIAATADVLKPRSRSVWVIGMMRDESGRLLPLHHMVADLHAANGFRMCEEVVLAQRNNGAITRVGNFDRGNHHLVRTHEYLLVFESRA
jgi:hypothetical protein